jgi:hypothetical protein
MLAIGFSSGGFRAYSLYGIYGILFVAGEVRAANVFRIRDMVPGKEAGVVAVKVKIKNLPMRPKML